MSGSVSDILTPFCKIKFDIFDNSNEQVNENKILWDGLMATFEAQVVAIDKRTNVLIDASFAELRSTEAALQLLLHFKEIKSRQSISEVVSGKLRDQCSPPLPVRHSMFPAYRCGDVVGCLLVH